MGPFKYLLGDYGDVKWKKIAKYSIACITFNCLYKIGLWYHVKLQHLFFLINIYSVSVARNANLFAFCFLFNLTAFWVAIKGTDSDLNEGYFNQQLSDILIGVGEVQF